MNLLELTLRNFGSYSDELVDFEGLHVVGLIGPNGSGKTTFTEAISWALFGKGPKGGRRNDSDSYVTDFQTECYVLLKFELNLNIYRVERTWNKESRKGVLNFEILGDKWEPIGKGKKDTQEEIIKTLGIDYKAFVASVFSPQGKSDSLTSDGLDDMEKKEIFSTIFDLGFWDKILNNTAKEQKEVKDKLILFSEKIKPLKELVETEPSIKEEIKSTEESLKTTENKVNNLAIKISDLEKEIMSYEPSLKEKERLEKEIEALSKDYDEKINGIKIKADNNQTEISNLEATVNLARKEIEEFQAILSRKEEIGSKINELNTLKKEIEDCDKLQISYNKIKLDLEKAEKKESAWETKKTESLSSLTTSLKKDQEIASLLDKVPCSNELKKECPLLKKANIAASSVDDLSKRCSKLICEISPHDEEIALLRQNLSSVGYVSEAHQEKKDTYKELQKYLDLNNKLAVAEAEKKHLLKTKKEKKEQIVRLKEDYKAICFEKETLIKENQFEEIFLTDSLKKIIEKVSGQEEFKKELKNSKEEKDFLVQQANNYREEIGALKQKLLNITNSKKELAKLEKEIIKWEEEMQVLSIISKAANKKSGIPIFIIENSLPQVEKLTTEVLDQLTDGRFSISIETQIEAKTTDNLQEVFQVFVYDNGALRPYHQFSGAEKFIIDLSIRVGVCKYLTHRSGTAIKTLIIDEGLSSLDEENRPKIISIFPEIGKDFDKIFITTHIRELQEALSQKIYFSRSETDGTKISIVR